jgi:hypothetical protein
MNHPLEKAASHRYRFRRLLFIPDAGMSMRHFEYNGSKEEAYFIFVSDGT